MVEKQDFSLVHLLATLCQAFRTGLRRGTVDISQRTAMLTQWYLQDPVKVDGKARRSVTAAMDHQDQSAHKVHIPTTAPIRMTTSKRSAYEC